MSIRRGQDWGTAGALAPDAPIVHDDHEARALLQAALDAGQPFGELGLLGGDLHRTLGAPRHDERDLRGGRGMRFSVDVGQVRLDGGPQLVFVAHLVATATRRGALFSGPTVVAMNATFLGPLDLGPRAHPGDGRLDVTEGELPPGERRAGRRRARSGSHVPHPGLSERRVRHAQLEADRRWHVRLDGDPVGSAHRLELRCLPDALVVVV